MTTKSVQIEGQIYFYTTHYSEHDGGYYTEIYDVNGCDIAVSDVFSTRQKALNDARKKAAEELKTA